MRFKQISLILICVFAAPWCRGYESMDPDYEKCNAAKEIVVAASVALIKNATSCEAVEKTPSTPFIEIKCFAPGGKTIRDIWIAATDFTNTDVSLKDLVLSRKAFYGTLGSRKKIHMGYNTNCWDLWELYLEDKAKEARPSGTGGAQ